MFQAKKYESLDRSPSSVGKVILAELNVWHSRPAVPTRRVALGDDQLNFEPHPGAGGLLLAAVVAVHAQQLDDDENHDLTNLLNLLELGARVPQPRLRHRLQEDRIGLTRSTHQLLGLPNGTMKLEIAPSNRPEPHVLAALYRVGAQGQEKRRSLFTLIRSAQRWKGQDHDDLLRFLSGASGSSDWVGGLQTDPTTWALEVLGFSAQLIDDLPDSRTIRRTFRQLLRSAHPDHGGAAENAGSRIEALTAARNILLKRRRM